MPKLLPCLAHGLPVHHLAHVEHLGPGTSRTRRNPNPAEDTTALTALAETARAVSAVCGGLGFRASNSCRCRSHLGCSHLRLLGLHDLACPISASRATPPPTGWRVPSLEAQPLTYPPPAGTKPSPDPHGLLPVQKPLKK